MKKKTILLFNIFLLLLSAFAMSQDKYFTKSGRISFFSTAPMENIEAHHRSVSAVLDKNGNIQFSLLMKGFEFKKALMQEHFNKKYVESDQFPKAEFKGQIINNSEINYATDGNYPARVKGKLTLHGQTREIETNGFIKVKGKRFWCSCHILHYARQTGCLHLHNHRKIVVHEILHLMR